MKLSICMMVKDEEKRLEECLVSLNPLRQSLKSELIIVDTGSTDRTVEIARQYTTKILFRPWEQDFSGMRNFTIQDALGDWLLIIDADEVLEQPQELIDFLKSKREKKYNSVALDVRNFTTRDLQDFSLIPMPRLFRRGTLHFEGKIHNQPIYQLPGIKMEKSHLLHYGYLNDDAELMERKFQRTATILQQELAQDPENIYYHFQLASSYYLHGDLELARQESDRAYALINGDPVKMQNCLYVFAQQAKIHLTFKDFQRARDICRQGLDLVPEYLDLWLHRLTACSELKEYSEAVEAGREYLRLLAIYSTLAISREISVVMDTLHYKDQALLAMANNSYQLQDYQGVLENFQQLAADFPLGLNSLKLFIDASFGAKEFTSAKEYIFQRLTDLSSQVINQIIFYLERQQLKLDPSSQEEFYRAFSGPDSDYQRLNQVRSAYKTQDPNWLLLAQKYLQETDWNAASVFEGDIFYYLLEQPDSDLVDIFTLIREENLQLFFRRIMEHYSDTVPRIISFLENLPQDAVFSSMRTRKFLWGCILGQKNELDKNQGFQGFLEYIENGSTYLKQVYNPLVLENQLYTVLRNVEEIFLYLCSYGLQIWPQDPERAQRFFAEAQRIQPSFKAYVHRLQEELAKP